MFKELLSKITVVSMRPSLLPHVVYIGRNAKRYKRVDNGLGNPFTIGKDGDRDAVVKTHYGWIMEQIGQRNPEVINGLQAIMDMLFAYGQCELECFCAPKACHGDNIKHFLCQDWCQKILMEERAKALETDMYLEKYLDRKSPTVLHRSIISAPIKFPHRIELSIPFNHAEALEKALLGSDNEALQFLGYRLLHYLEVINHDKGSNNEET